MKRKILYKTSSISVNRENKIKRLQNPICSSNKIKIKFNDFSTNKEKITKINIAQTYKDSWSHKKKLMDAIRNEEFNMVNKILMENELFISQIDAEIQELMNIKAITEQENECLKQINLINNEIKQEELKFKNYVEDKKTVILQTLEQLNDEEIIGDFQPVESKEDEIFSGNMNITPMYYKENHNSSESLNIDANTLQEREVDCVNLDLLKELFRLQEERINKVSKINNDQKTIKKEVHAQEEKNQQQMQIQEYKDKNIFSFHEKLVNNDYNIGKKVMVVETPETFISVNENESVNSVEEFIKRQKQLLLGKKLNKNIEDSNGNIIATTGMLIDVDLLEMVTKKKKNAIIEMAIYSDNERDFL